MTLNNNGRIQFIYQGKQYLLNIKLYKYFKDKIPMYYCQDIEQVEVIELANNNIFILLNKEYESKINATDLDIIIWHNILTVYFKHTNKILSDICVAYWFGFSKTIAIINALKNIDNTEKKERVKVLEKLVYKEQIVSIPSQFSILKELKYIKTT